MTAIARRVQRFGELSGEFLGRIGRLDRVWLALGAMILALALLKPSQVVPSLGFTGQAFLSIAPFLLVSVVLAAWLKAAGADRLIGAAVSRAPVVAILIATVAGAFSPFCSCGVVPLIAALLAAGVPLPVVMAFWMSSPLMDPEMFVLMAVQLPMDFTWAKVASAVAMGLLAGFSTLLLARFGLFASPLRAMPGCGGAASGLGRAPVHFAVWREPARRIAFHQEALGVAHFLSKWLLLAFFIESLMVAWLPGGLVAHYLGGGDLGSIFTASALGVPAYLNGYAAIPLVGQLMENGMAPGAGLAFMVAGGVTSLPAAMAVYAVARRRVFLWYLALALVGSAAIGFAYQLFVSGLSL